jgi:hypothetical protein
MRSIPAFSKKSSKGPTITSGLNKENRQRAGFTKSVYANKVSGPVSTPKGIVKGKDFGSTKTYKGGPSVPKHSGKIAPKVPPAFSKKKI